LSQFRAYRAFLLKLEALSASVLEDFSGFRSNHQFGKPAVFIASTVPLMTLPAWPNQTRVSVADPKINI
ncbi:hypothetical protein WBG06_11790, partial [Nocardioides sp. CCNWLW239]|uniref:hypothetical protein n=1 Tax=Nocardioides sp. CCNWLW239 TaxID=3128902 RepID=UPI00301AAE58